MFRVHLANGNTLHFTSKREAAACAADARRFLEQTVLEANALLGTALQEHRTAWPLLADLRLAALQNADARIRAALANATDLLDRATVPQATPDGMYHAWKHTRNAIEHLQAAFQALEAVYQYKTMGVLRWRMANYLQQAKAAHQRMALYGADAGNVTRV